MDFDLDFIDDYYGELKNYNYNLDLSKCDYRLFDPYEIVHKRIFKYDYSHIPGFDEIIDMIAEEIVQNNTF